MSDKMNMKTPLKIVRGFGASKTGTDHFWQQRATGVANLVLMFLLVLFIIMHLGASRAEIVQSMRHPFIAIFMVMALASACWHMRLGVQVVIEDYVHTNLRKFTLLALNIAYSTMLFTIAAYSILKMSFGS